MLEKHVSIVQNDVSNRSFIYAIEFAQLGNCLSTYANLCILSKEIDTPIIYYGLAKFEGLFESAMHHFILNFGEHFEINDTALARFNAYMTKSVSKGLDAYSSDHGVVSPDELVSLEKIRGCIVSLNYHPDFRNLELVQEDFSRFCNNGNAIFLPGAYWWQYRASSASLSGIGESLRSMLKIKHQDGCVLRRIEMSQGNNKLLIGVHIRLGDYKSYRGGEYFFSVSQYIHVLQAISVQINRPHAFVIVSNEAIDPIDFASLNTIAYLGGAFDDFVALTKCDFIVGPPSTFSNWAAFLGRGKRVVLTAERIQDSAVDWLAEARDIFPTQSGVEGDFW